MQIPIVVLKHVVRPVQQWLNAALLRLDAAAVELPEVLPESELPSIKEDRLVWSSVLVGPGGARQQKLFTIPQGQAMARLIGSAYRPPDGFFETYDQAATNLYRAGELGSDIGDVAIHKLSADFIAPPVLPTGCTTITGASFSERVFLRARPQLPQPARDHAAEDWEVLKQNLMVTFRVAGRRHWEGPLSMLAGDGLKLRLPILVASFDTIEATLEVPASAALHTTGPLLVRVFLHTIAQGST